MKHYKERGITNVIQVGLTKKFLVAKLDELDGMRKEIAEVN